MHDINWVTALRYLLLYPTESSLNPIPSSGGSAFRIRDGEFQQYKIGPGGGWESAEYHSFGTLKRMDWHTVHVQYQLAVEAEAALHNYTVMRKAYDDIRGDKLLYSELVGITNRIHHEQLDADQKENLKVQQTPTPSSGSWSDSPNTETSLQRVTILKHSSYVSESVKATPDDIGRWLNESTADEYNAAVEAFEKYYATRHAGTVTSPLRGLKDSDESFPYALSEMMLNPGTIWRYAHTNYRWDKGRNRFEFLGVNGWEASIASPEQLMRSSWERCLPKSVLVNSTWERSLPPKAPKNKPPQNSFTYAQSEMKRTPGTIWKHNNTDYRWNETSGYLECRLAIQGWVKSVATYTDLIHGTWTHYQTEALETPPSKTSFLHALADMMSKPGIIWTQRVCLYRWNAKAAYLETRIEEGVEADRIWIESIATLTHLMRYPWRLYQREDPESPPSAEQSFIHALAYMMTKSGDIWKHGMQLYSWNKADGCLECIVPRGGWTRSIALINELTSGPWTKCDRTRTNEAPCSPST